MSATAPPAAEVFSALEIAMAIGASKRSVQAALDCAPPTRAETERGKYRGRVECRSAAAQARRTA